MLLGLALVQPLGKLLLHRSKGLVSVASSTLLKSGGIDRSPGFKIEPSRPHCHCPSTHTSC